MGVYIKGMEMPGRCGHCPCFNAENPIRCQAVKADKAKRIAAPYGLPRPDWCPLGEVPTPHGRLIDADAFKKYCEDGMANMMDEFSNVFFKNLALELTCSFIEDIDEQETVIEAEGAP